MLVVLFTRETRFLNLCEEYRLIVFAHRVLRKLFWPKRDETTGEWKRLHNEDILITG